MANHNSRRVALGDEGMRRGGIGRPSLNLIRSGTHAHGAYGGTVTFKGGAFQGTPTVMLTPIGGGYRLSGGGTFIPLTVTGRFPGSFTYFGSPKHGTFSWLAIGSNV